LGANLTSWLRLTAGYSFLYWNAVARPGNQISPVANATQIPGDPLYGAAGFPSTANPLFHFNDEHFWVQTVSCGLEIHY
jgi:hypothetical protein